MLMSMQTEVATVEAPRKGLAGHQMEEVNVQSSAKRRRLNSYVRCFYAQQITVSHKGDGQLPRVANLRLADPFVPSLLKSTPTSRRL